MLLISSSEYQRVDMRVATEVPEVDDDTCGQKS